MMRIPFVFFLFIATYPLLFAQQPKQSIRGLVLDEASGSPISSASILLLNTDSNIGATSDSLGYFIISEITVGRYDIQVSHVNYTPVIIREVVLTSSKQTVLTIRLKESITELSEVVITPQIVKEQPLNPMAMVSARMLSVEEAKRYAGGFDDPARLASAFAGVTGNTDVNGIIVRGNAPKYVQWKMEGIEIPNPNHFGDLRVIGGGALTALSSQMLANSDFFTGAFPAEYNNALSGVFDINMRQGNNQKRESTFQLGIIGIDAASEGPFKRGGKSSYLFNYRYSTLALLQPLLPENANTLKYQDLSFKLNFPTKRAGTFTVWGLGLMDDAVAKPKTDPLLWVYKNDRQDDRIQQYVNAAGISHQYFLNNSTYIKTTLATTSGITNWNTQRLNDALDLMPYSNIKNVNQNFIFKSIINKKINSRHVNNTGVLVTGMKYNLLLENTISPNSTPTQIVNANGFSTLISAYSNSLVSITDQLTLNTGINAQWFMLNNNYTIEPRAGLRHQINEKHSMGFAYGLHSRLENLNYYFNDSFDTGEKAVNKNLDFTRAHHFVLSYDWQISDLVHFKAEPYYQQLFNVPVVANSSLSFVNLEADWFFNQKLQNTGRARNYGFDFTLEKFMSQGYYYLLTASIFNSRYMGGDGIWRSSRFNRNYVINALFGKEWYLSSARQHVLSLNTRFTYQGGNRYSPVDVAASVQARDVVFDNTQAFANQAAPGLNVHFTASYKINKKKLSHEISLKILNLTGRPDFYGYKYNFRDNTIDQDLASVVIPNLSYKIEF